MTEFKRPTLADQQWVDELLACGHERGCEYNFSTLYLWCHAFHVEIARLGDFFTERLCAPNGCHYLFPVGRGMCGRPRGSGGGQPFAGQCPSP